MGDYNLAGLNTRDFEHLTQSLAIAVIAPGITPFGDGPDGGREATFTGEMSYPTDRDSWDGYLVIQSKFRVRPEGSSKDGGWAVEQLKGDLAKFTDSKRKLPKPQYYLFVTNAILTPTQNTGSKDKVIRVLEEYRGRLGLKDYDIWDYDKLCRLLDSQDAIRTRYAAFITAGDVLSAMMRALQDRRPMFEQIALRHLQNELLAVQFVRLEQAGHTADQKTLLSQVFVDLPASEQPNSEQRRAEQEQQEPFGGIVAELLEAGSRSLKPSTLIDPIRLTIDDLKASEVPQPGRFVLVGGPGQGKSTIGQFICQVHRAAILSNQPRTRIA